MPTIEASWRPALGAAGLLLALIVSCNGREEPLPPATPKGLTAEAGTGSITLRWEANEEDDLLRYNLFRADGDGDLVAIAAVPAGTETYTDTDVADGLSYRYAIDAENLRGLRSARTAEVIGTPLERDATGLWDESLWDEAVWAP